MPNNDIFSIEFEGLDEYIDLLEGYPKEMEKAMVAEMTPYSLLVEGGAKQLTPVDTNELTKSITTSKVQRIGNEFVFTIGSDLPYALKMHEHQGNWGVRTMLKQAKSWRGYMPGNKYLENAVRATENDWNKAMENVLNRVIR